MSNKAKFLCKVAGVTFCNDDGESRQEIMKNIIDNDGDGERWFGPGKLRLATGVNFQTNEKLAYIEVCVKDKCIGIVPQNKKEEVASNKMTQSYSVLVDLAYYHQHDMYVARLYTPNRTLPTKNMERAVREILRQNPKLERPEKTFDAYRQFLNDYRGGVIDQLRSQQRILDWELDDENWKNKQDDE
jgi:hypothetical protein